MGWEQAVPEGVPHRLYEIEDTSLIRESGSNSCRHLREKALQERGQCMAEGAWNVQRRARRPKSQEAGVR